MKATLFAQLLRKAQQPSRTISKSRRLTQPKPNGYGRGVRRSFFINRAKMTKWALHYREKVISQYTFPVQVMTWYETTCQNKLFRLFSADRASYICRYYFHKISPLLLKILTFDVKTTKSCCPTRTAAPSYSNFFFMSFLSALYTT